MRLVDRLLNRQGYWEGQASGAAVLTTSYGNPNRESLPLSLMQQAHEAYKQNDVVFAAILSRMALFSEARFIFQRLTDKDTFTDQRLNVLQQPWPDGSEGELLTWMELDASVAGNFYLWDAGDQLYRWRPEWVTIISELVDGPRGQYRRKVGFHYEPPRDMQASYGDPQTAPVDEVVHWAPIPDPDASFRGMSWMTPIMKEQQADSGMTQYKIRYLENAASPNMLIKYAQKLNEGTVDNIRERMRARYGGVNNAFRTLVLDQGADATVIGNNLQQMDFSAVQSAGAERILAAAGVPGVIIGLESLRGAGRSYEDSINKFANLWARPQWRSACAALQKLTGGNDIDAGAVRLWYDTSDITALQEGEQARAQISLVHAQALLTLRQAGYTRDSAMKAVESNDVSQLELDPDAVPPKTPAAGQSQHMLPQAPGSGPLPGLQPLPEGRIPRLPVGTTSPGDRTNGTRPSGRPASVRRDEN